MARPLSRLSREPGRPVTLTAADKCTPTGRIHWAWVVAAVSFIAILGAAGSARCRHLLPGADVFVTNGAVGIERFAFVGPL
jgi:hypothetical protein